MKPHRPPLSYRDAGVDVDAGNALVDRIKPLAASTSREGVISGLGGFGALFELPLHRYTEPLLVSGTDGVGTKLRLAIDAGAHDTVGIDLVAMCANDILAQGAEPLFFLDYFATARLDVDVAEAVVRGIAEGCRRARMALIGGETAEMPGMYAAGDYDLAGFCVGIVERSKVVDGRNIEAGDHLIGIASSGPHANGFSLIRKIIEVTNTDLSQSLADRTLAQCLLEPTRIYVGDLSTVLPTGHIKGIAHITGGGLTDNIVRILPPGIGALVERKRWQLPPVFEWLREAGQLNDAELHRTFNCGVGMVLAVGAHAADETMHLLRNQGALAFEIGYTAAVDSLPAPVTVR